MARTCLASNSRFSDRSSLSSTLTVVVLCLLAFQAGCNSSAQALAKRNAAAIEAVLAADRTSIVGVTSGHEVVQRMRAIDLKQCPQDFQESYLQHIHAWELHVDALQKFHEFAEREYSWTTIAEALLRTFMGDPLGKLDEFDAELNPLKARLSKTSENVRLSYQSMENLAVKHGATIVPRQFPPRQTSR